MLGEYRFLKTRGSTRFARVGVEGELADGWYMEVAPEVALPKCFGGALREGVRIASDEHTARGGPAHRLRVVRIDQTASDTSNDAIRCAAAIATWKALGHEESDVDLVFEGAEWRVVFKQGA